MTGIFTVLGALLLPVVLYSLVSGPECYAWVHTVLSAWYGQVFLFLLSTSLVFHLLNGIRHLFWDMGFNLEVKSAEASGIAVILLTLGLTAFIWLVACLHYYGGGA